jgi:Secretion system C-terminal sorting domain
MKKIYTLFLIVFCLTKSLKAQTTFNITYSGFSTQAQAAYQYAADIWANTVVSTVPIKVTAHFSLLPSGTLGITFPNGRKNFAGAPVANRWYATSLANAITGTEINPGEADIEMYLNSTVNWYYGTSGTVPSGQYDMATIVLHEMCHGLGFLSLAKDSSGIGSFGMLRAADFYNLVTAFSWPNLDTLPSVFDEFLVTNAGAKLDSFPNPSTTLSPMLKNNTVYFNGTFAMAANGGIKPRIYAPATFALGSSITHLNESTYPAGNPNELMTPNGNPAYSLHAPGPICIGVLKDIGWTINPNMGVNEMQQNNLEFVVYPNPANSQLSLLTSIAKEKIKSVVIRNVLGEEVLRMDKNLSADVSSLSKGIYFIEMTTTETKQTQKFIKE